MDKMKSILKSLTSGAVAVALLLSLPSTALAEPDTEDLDAITDSTVEMEVAAEGEELVDQDGEEFVIPGEDDPLLPAQSEEEYAAVRAELHSEIAIVGVTWDSSVTDAPASVQLRSLHDGEWTEWTDLEVPSEPESTQESEILGTGEFLLIDAQKLEVAAFGEDGQAVEGLMLNVVDPLGAEEVENELESVETEDPATDDAEEDVEEEDSEPVLDESADDEEPLSEDELEDSELDQEATLETEDEQSEDPAESDLPQSGQVQKDVLLDLEGVAEGEAALLGDYSGELGVASAIPTKLSTGYLGLKINRRSEWGANESYRKGFVDKNVKYRGAVVHHTEGSNNYTEAQVPSVIRGIYYYHAVTLGWGDIGYHFLVDKYGGVWEGRYKTLSTSSPRGAHALGGNSDTFGISVLGGYMKKAPPQVAQNAVAKTIAWKLNKLGITNIDKTIKVPGYWNTVRGSSAKIDLPVVSAHRDVGATDCPGDAFYKRMPQIRTKVKNYMAQASTPSKASSSAPKVKAWDYGNIISDKVFYNGKAMTASQIQTFLNKEGASCKASGGKTCLKNTKFPTKKLKTLRGGCKPFTLTGKQSAAKIIAETGKVCGINPQVLLANLQKESSGIYQPLTATGWAKVMGSACPDGKPCDPNQAGFAQQVYYGADKLASYRLDSSWPYIAAVKSGKKVKIPYKYNKSSCGSASFVIKNNATASLYTYTPFAPNAATVANPSSGGSCSSPGWPIFRNYMIQWFPESMGAATNVVPKPKISGTVRYGNKVTVSGAAKSAWTPKASKVTYQWYRSGTAIKGATGSSYTLKLADVGKTLTVKATGMNGSKRIGSKTSAGKKVTGPQVSRLSAAGAASRSTAVNKAVAASGKPLFIASSQKSAHSFSVAPAVASEGGSMLLVSKKGPSKAQIARIKALRPSKVYVIGSKQVLPTSVFRAVQTASGKTPVRVTGTGKYATSRAIYNRFFAKKKGKTVFVSSGRNYWNAMSASAAGGATKSPVIILDGKAGKGLPASVARSLKATGRTNVVLVGGTGSVNAATRSAIRAQGFNTERISGKDRYTVNANLNSWLDKRLSGTSVKGLWVVPGSGFSSALTAAVPAGSASQRLVMSKKTCIPGGVVKSVKNKSSKVSKVRLVGPSSRLSLKIKNLPACG